VLAPRFAAVGDRAADEETLGAAAASQEDVRTTIEQHQHGDRFGRAVGLLVSQFHANGHSAHRADLQVKDHQVDAAFFDAGDDFGPLATSSMRRSGPSSVVRSSLRKEARSLARRTMAIGSA